MKRGLLGLALALVVAELAAWAALALLERRGVVWLPVPTVELSQEQQEAVRALVEGRNRYIGFDAELGWTVMPGGAAGMYHADSLGRRLPAPDPGPGERLVLAFGDSFTHGDEVADGESWPAALSESVDFAAWNYGVPGYGPDQAWLRWRREGRELEGAVVVVGFMSADLARVVNRFVPFLDPRTGLPLTKPSLTHTGGGFHLEANSIQELEELRALIDAPGPTLARLGEGDPFYEAGPRAGVMDALALVSLGRLAWHRAKDPLAGVRGGQPYDVESQAFRATTRLFEAWRAKSAAASQELVIVLLPGRADLAAITAGGEAAYAPLAAWLREAGIPALDAAPAVLEVPEGERFQPGGHYTSEANRRVGSAVAELLRRR